MRFETSQKVRDQQWLTLFALAGFLSLMLVFSPQVASQANSFDDDEHIDQIDPWEGFNRRVFGFNQFLDRWLLKPAAKGYRWVTPGFVDRSISNFFKNLADVPGLVNAGLQGDFRQMGISTGRVLVNTTIGVAGFIDIASDAGLERRPEDFGQTLAVWGVGSGPYVELPLFGGRHLRHAFSMIPDSYMDPVRYVDDNEVRIALAVTRIVDARADLIAAEALISGDRYSFIRDVYMQRRESAIGNGQSDPTADPFDDFDSDDFGDESF